VSVVPHVTREVHGGHPAPAELALDDVAVGQRRRKATDFCRVHRVDLPEMGGSEICWRARTSATGIALSPPRGSEV
jgi:hypothetical protein